MIITYLVPAYKRNLLQLTSKQLIVTTHVQCVVLAAIGVLINGDLEERRRERERQGGRKRERESEGEGEREKKEREGGREGGKERERVDRIMWPSHTVCVRVAHLAVKNNTSFWETIAYCKSLIKYCTPQLATQQLTIELFDWFQDNKHRITNLSHT